MIKEKNRAKFFWVHCSSEEAQKTFCRITGAIADDAEKRECIIRRQGGRACPNIEISLSLFFVDEGTLDLLREEFNDTPTHKVGIHGFRARKNTDSVKPLSRIRYTDSELQQISPESAT